MGYYCTVPQCTSLAGKTKNVKFHRFPRDVTMADKWNLILKRGKPYTKYSKVCSLHFTQSDYNVTTMGKTKGQWKTLSKDAVPSQNLPKLNADGTVMVIRKSRTVKYRETKKEDIQSDKSDKWGMPISHIHRTSQIINMSESALSNTESPQSLESGLAYRLQSLHAIADNISPQNHGMKPKKQDAIMQTEPVQSEEDDTQPNNSCSEPSEALDYPIAQYKDTEYENPKSYDAPKDYTKNDDDYIPQTNEEYNKEAEKYALERKSHNGYDKPVLDTVYQKPVPENGYQKVQDVYNYDKYQRTDFTGYQNGYQDSVEMLRNQQHNLQMLQEQHRITGNENFFNENHIKQEIDMNVEDDKYMYERSKEQLDANSQYESQRRLTQQQRLMEQLQHQVKQEPDASGACDSVLQPQGSPYYPPAVHNNLPGGFYEGASRPGPELLIAKQNALAAHTQLWQNTMKRPFFYSESPPYNTPQILHRYEDVSRILQ
ncbi:uncharacterized protein LOC131854141 isoform X2 [Achroia grisella]|uniref:uncharacterized protein LOC131854141 isoform X2 n=1 Tax=Achroia grisella TaxID=688607 RepID=UPI0027D276D5|nr:uncharacterized protein LOC131854141 isoform X2 [Achroia grisella]